MSNGTGELLYCSGPHRRSLWWLCKPLFDALLFSFGNSFGRLDPARWSLLSKSSPEALSLPKPPSPAPPPQKLSSPSAMHIASSFICLIGTALELMSHGTGDNKKTREGLPSLHQTKLMGGAVQDAAWQPVTGNLAKIRRQWLCSPAVSSPGAGPHPGPRRASGCGHCLYWPPAALPLPAPSAQPATND